MAAYRSMQISQFDPGSLVLDVHRLDCETLPLRFFRPTSILDEHLSTQSTWRPGMPIDRTDIRRMVAGRSVGVVAAVLVGAGALMAFGVFERLGDPSVGLLSPVWMPVYLAILAASGLRNVYLPWVGSGVAFSLLVAVLLYLEAVLLAGFFRTLRAGYRCYHRGTTDEAPS